MHSKWEGEEREGAGVGEEGETPKERKRNVRVEERKRVDISDEERHKM